MDICSLEGEGSKEHRSCIPESWAEEAEKRSQQKTASHPPREEDGHPAHFPGFVWPWLWCPSCGCRRPVPWQHSALAV